jgi:hypothetical protein
MTALRCRGSLAFPPCDRTFEARTHDRVRHRVRLSAATTCWTIRRRSLSKTRVAADPLASTMVPFPAPPCGELLSWGSSNHPSTDNTARVHSRTSRRPSFGGPRPSGPLVPSMSFHPTPTVSSSCSCAGLLHPAAGHGVRRVSIPRARHECRARRSQDLPYGAYPSKLFPCKQP